MLKKNACRPRFVRAIIMSFNYDLFMINAGSGGLAATEQAAECRGKIGSAIRSNSTDGLVHTPSRF